MRAIWTVIKSALKEFIDDDALTLSAALALYAALSLAPLLLVAIWIAGLLWRGAQDEAAQRAASVVGEQAAGIIRTVLVQASKPAQNTTVMIMGIGMFVFYASGVFAQLQYSLNKIWKVQARPDAGIKDWLRKRLWTVVMMIVIGAVFLASLIAAAVLSAVQHHLQDVIREGWVWWRANQIIPLILFILLFAMMFKILPDVSLRWRDVWFGATVTAVLFLIGRYLIGLYIGMRSVTSVYGAAGSLVALLTWLYYSSLIFFFGAELTQAYARARGSRIEPDKHAVWIRQPSRPRRLCIGTCSWP